MQRIIGLFFALCAVGAQAGELPKLDKALAWPPQMTARQIVLANAELHPSVVNRTKVVLASDYNRNIEEAASGATPYAELAFTYRKSRKESEAPGLTTVNLYGEYPLSETVSVFGSLYHDKSFQAAYAGLSKKFGNWQVALGVGSAWYDGVRHNVVNPWVYYSSDEYEGFFSAEHYSNETVAPWFYKGHFEKKLGKWGVGVYGEKDFGVGPRVSYKFEKVKLWATVPMANLPKTGRMVFMIGATYEF